MNIALQATELQQAEITQHFSGVNWVPIDTVANTDAIMVLTQTDTFDYTRFEQPIFVNEVTTTLGNINAPSNVLRINGWPGFLARNVWEIAGTVTTSAHDTLRQMGVQYVEVPDQPGFISARVLAMIINEAWLTLEEGVSSKADIDTAMKLGTNYPKGPFEWGQLIGETNILNLLETLSTIDTRYTPSKLLKSSF